MIVRKFNVRNYLRRQIRKSHYLKESKIVLRRGLLIGLVLFSLFGFLDPQLAPHDYKKIFIVRFAVIVPAIVVCFTLTYSKKFYSLLQLIVVAATLIPCLGLAYALTIYDGSDFQLVFFSGLVVAVSFAPMVLGLNSFFTAFCTIVTVAAFNAIAYLRLPDTQLFSGGLFFGTNAILISAGLLGCSFQFFINKLLRSNALHILQLTRHKRQLEKSRMDLTESYDVKNKLLFIISHDIRGPLASIKGILDLIRGKMITDWEFRQHASNLSSLVQSTGGLLDNLLHWSLSHYNSHRLKLTECNIYELLEMSFNMFESKAINKGLTFHNKIDRELFLKLDYTLANLIFRNIISNAVKFTSEGHIVAECGRQGNQIEIVVTDTGVGMDTFEYNSLFSWAKTRNTRSTDNERGSGLGLILCKEFIERHGGNLTVKSEKWRGTSVSIIFPEDLYVVSVKGHLTMQEFAG